MLESGKPPRGGQYAMPLARHLETPDRPAPPLDYRIGCDCPTCQLGKLLWWTEEHAKPEWEHWFAVLERRITKGDVPVREYICWWQWHRWTLRQERV